MLVPLGVTGGFESDNCFNASRGYIVTLSSILVGLVLLPHFDGAVGFNFDFDCYDKMMSPDSALVPGS